MSAITRNWNDAHNEVNGIAPPSILTAQRGRTRTIGNASRLGPMLRAGLQNTLDGTGNAAESNARESGIKATAVTNLGYGLSCRCPLCDIQLEIAEVVWGEKRGQYDAARPDIATNLAARRLSALRPR